MVKHGETWWKVVKSGEKWEKVVKSGEKWGKVGKSGKKLWKVVKSGEKWWRVGEKWEKVGKVVKSGEKWEKWWKVGKSWEKWLIVGNFFTKWPLAAILDDRKSLSIAFLAISDQYATFIFFFQNGRQQPFWIPIFLPKSIGTDLYSMWVAASNMKLIGAFLIKL